VACSLSCHLKRQTFLTGSVQGPYGSPALKLRMSANSSQPEGASLESCCVASSGHGSARTEAQSLGLVAYFATSDFKRNLGMGVPGGLLSQPCS